MMELFLVILLVIVTIRCIGNKISALAMLLYIQDHCEVPDEDQIRKYAEKAADKLFHFKNK